MSVVEKYLNLFEQYVSDQVSKGDPKSLYDPISYIMSQSGKRLRPMLVMLAADACGSEVKSFLPIAYAVEVFHNFTLVHDDIMDHADLRRGKPTVYHKYGTEQAILSGDLMSIQAYEAIVQSKLPNQLDAIKWFTDTNKKICEGQQWDMDFEKISTISVDQYLKMIEYKTAVLLGCSLGLGALMSDVPRDDADLFYKIGIDAGIAFQIKDDYLDTFGEEASVGKVIGGDIVNSKKTILYVLQSQSLSQSQKEEFNRAYHSDDADKVSTITSLFKANNIDEEALQMESEYFDRALQNMKILQERGYDLSHLAEFFANLQNRLK